MNLRTVFIIISLAAMSAVLPTCSPSDGAVDVTRYDDAVRSAETTAAETIETSEISITQSPPRRYLRAGIDYDRPLDKMPEPTQSLPLKFHEPYRTTFNDSNAVHWADAERIGIEPLSDTRSHWRLRRPLVKIASCEDFYVEPLTYSSPYLVPEAAAMLHEIGRRFHDTLAVRGGGDYSIKVTSILRTPESVSRLRRHNANAIDSSVHQFGTTVDISYSQFAAYNDRLPRSAVDLKAILAEVLVAMRREGKCWIKHEHRQPCFHITARPRS